MGPGDDTCPSTPSRDVASVASDPCLTPASSAKAESNSLEPLLSPKPVQITCLPIIHGGSLGGKPWPLEDVSTVQGIHFARLKISDVNFSRFVVGSCAKRLWGFTYLNTLRAMRNMEMSKILGTDAKARAMFGDKAKPLSKYRVQKNRKSSDKNADERPAWVELDLPAVSYGDESSDGVTCKLLWVKDMKEYPGVEVEAHIFSHIRLAILEEGRNIKPPREPEFPAEKGIFWLQDRGSWVAYRKEDNKRTIKYFTADREGFKRRKPAKAAEEARRQALAWSKGGDADTEGTALSDKDPSKARCIGDEEGGEPGCSGGEEVGNACDGAHDADESDAN